MEIYAVIFIVVAYYFYLIKTQDDGSGSQYEYHYEDTTYEPETRDPSYYDTGSGDYITDAPTSPDPHVQRCMYLNDIRANYTVCCKYPGLVIWYWQMEACRKKCRREDRDDDQCCILPCCLYYLGVLVEGEGDQWNVDYRGLAYSFLLSVGNDTVWMPVIEGSTQRCYDDNLGAVEGYQCNVIPMFLYKIIDCAYKENFLKCPVWNPNRLKQCETTRTFVDECT